MNIGEYLQLKNNKKTNRTSIQSKSHTLQSHPPKSKVHTIQNNIIQSHPPKTHALKESPLQSHIIQSHTLKSNTLQEHTIQRHTIKSHTLQSYTSKSHTFQNYVIKQKPLSVNIGIDFGTSYTKIAFTAQNQNTPRFVQLVDSSDFIPSVVYFSRMYDTVSIRNCGTKVQYFKYTAVYDNLPRISGAKTKTRIEILFCVYFLAFVISATKNKIRQYYKDKRQIDENTWTITMAVPVESKDEKKDKKNKDVYDRILFCATMLSQENIKEEVPILKLDEMYQNAFNKDIHYNGLLNTLPELYAESLSFIHSPNTPCGLYALIDIGGGTLDIALLLKQKDNIINSGKPTISFVKKTVMPYGVESLCEKLTKNDTINYKLAKQYIYEDCNIPLNILKTTKEDLQTTFRRLVINAKNNIDVAKAFTEQNKILPVLFCGGGANYGWYKNAINDCRTGLKSGGVTLHIEDTKKILHLTDTFTHRHIIAANLSRPFENIDRLSGFPWHFEYMQSSRANSKSNTSNLVFHMSRYEDSGYYSKEWHNMANVNDDFPG